MKNKEVKVTVTLGEDPCLHIKNSYLIKTKEDIMRALEFIHTTRKYMVLKKGGYSRTLKSEYQEWAAHNFLYRMGYKRERTRSVDINQNETKLRKFIYAVLSIF
jgi:predicted small secreted protein